MSFLFNRHHYAGKIIMFCVLCLDYYGLEEMICERGLGFTSFQAAWLRYRLRIDEWSRRQTCTTFNHTIGLLHNSLA